LASAEWVRARETAAVFLDRFLQQALDDPCVLVEMAANGVSVVNIKDLITDIVLWRLSRDSVAKYEEPEKEEAGA